MKALKELLLEGLTPSQSDAVQSVKRKVLVVAGAGSGKTEVMARRIAWWTEIDKVAKNKIVAFTFTERAAEEMKFRIRAWLQRVADAGKEVSLGGMYIGTIHGFCLAKIREYWPDDYHNYDILDEGARASLVMRGFNGLLALKGLKDSLNVGQVKVGQYATMEMFLQAFDQLQEHMAFDIKLPAGDPPFELGAAEREWCNQAQLITNVGDTDQARAFAISAARYYAYLRCRRFLDFSTSQSELVRRLETDGARLQKLHEEETRLVVDEVQDINPVQRRLIGLLVGHGGSLTAVGDHRQSIYGFRGAKVEILGELWKTFASDKDSAVVDLRENFRSTPRIIDLANSWAASISALGSMQTPTMKHGNKLRDDQHRSHTALISFDERTDEAEWIAQAIRVLVPSEAKGAVHDKRDGSRRGLTLSDVAVLVRSSTDVRTYMRALETSNVPCVVRAGPDLYSQPEVLLFIAVLSMSAGVNTYFGSATNPKSLPSRIARALGCGPVPSEVFAAAASALRTAGLPFGTVVETRLAAAAAALCQRIIEDKTLTAEQVKGLRTPKLREFLLSKNQLRRVFPQQLFHMLLSEAEVDSWDSAQERGQTALFHLGALSGLITGLETPGWTSAKDYPWQIIGLCQYGAEEGRAEEQPLMVQPDAVSISTIHAAKGLEFAAVFIADVNASRFPSSMATRRPTFPLAGPILNEIDVAGLSDNSNHDGERRLMYVALTRAERFLFISHSGSRTSKFIKELRGFVGNAGGLVTDNADQLLAELKYAPKEHQRSVRLATSFSDLRYYLECPHDFYLRKVLGFAPTIDQAFGYGRGVHNLLRAVHADPKKWAALAANPKTLQSAIQELVDKGLFYLRYTTGDPAQNMRLKGVRVVSDYIQRYVKELGTLTFEPEKEFETLVEYEDGPGGALVSGSIDIVRQDDPPRVTLIDFKSGDPESDNHQKLDSDEMQLQVALYAIAAKKELEYQPEQGLVRYLDANPGDEELTVPLSAEALAAAKSKVARTAGKIRDRAFSEGPVAKLEGEPRCKHCDFVGFCGNQHAMEFKSANPKSW
jgi:DNA helicase-2/ATP-dependent DNA helicase PcrA